MAGDMHHRHRQGAEGEGVAIAEQMIELRAILRELTARVEQLAEHLLDLRDMLADSDPAAELFLQIGRGREMIGVGMGLQQPGDCQIMSPAIGDHRIGAGGSGAARCRIEIEHRIDDRRLPAFPVMHDIADGKAVPIKEARNFRLQCRIGLRGLDLCSRGCKHRIGHAHGASPSLWSTSGTFPPARKWCRCIFRKRNAANSRKGPARKRAAAPAPPLFCRMPCPDSRVRRAAHHVLH